MRRRTVSLLVAGWLLGLLTAFLLPDLSAEHRSFVMTTSLDRFSLQQMVEHDGWRMARTDRAGETAIVQLERPRYLGIVMALENLSRGLGVSSPRPTPALPKPTEAPKPATAPRTP
jgi:hypothetical protein